MNNFDVPKMGYHLILEFTGVTAIDLNNYDQIDAFLSKTITDCRATIENKCHKLFEPQGVTVLYLLSESHFSIHTWPESNSCAIDFYHCGVNAKRNLTDAEILLCDKFGWENCSGSMLIERGGKRQAMLNHYDHQSTLFRGVKLLHREQSKYQELRVMDTETMGRILCLDQMIQITDNTCMEDNYTIDMSRKIVEKNNTYEQILIIGAGDMIIPTHILQNNPGVKKVIVCEIDDRVIENTRKYFKFCDGIDDLIKQGRLEIVIEDGAKYLKTLISQGQKFDGLIIDNSDVYIFDGPAAALFTPEFYANILSVLKPGAPFSQQVSDENVKAKWENMIKGVGFRDIEYIYSNTPEYSQPLPLGIAKKDL